MSFFDDAKSKIDSIVNDFNSFNELGTQTEEKIKKLLKGHISLGYDILSPDWAYKTTKDDVNKAELQYQKTCGKTKEQEIALANYISKVYNRLNTCKHFSKINIEKLGLIYKKIATELKSCKNENEADSKKNEFVLLIKDFNNKVLLGKDLNEEIKSWIQKLNELFIDGSNLFQEVV